jgi:hypothetical protein
MHPGAIHCLPGELTGPFKLGARREKAPRIIAV